MNKEYGTTSNVIITEKVIVQPELTPRQNRIINILRGLLYSYRQDLRAISRKYPQLASNTMEGGEQGGGLADDCKFAEELWKELIEEDGLEKLMLPQVIDWETGTSQNAGTADVEAMGGIAPDSSVKETSGDELAQAVNTALRKGERDYKLVPAEPPTESGFSEREREIFRIGMKFQKAFVVPALILQGIEIDPTDAIQPDSAIDAAMLEAGLVPRSKVEREISIEVLGEVYSKAFSDYSYEGWPHTRNAGIRAVARALGAEERIGFK